MDPMTDLMMWDLIVGFVSATFVLPVIQQPRWTERRRALVTFVYSVVAGAVTAYLTDVFTGLDSTRGVATSILTVLVTAIATYKGLAKPTGLAQRIELATSPGRRPGDPLVG